ncbi:FadR family transcriptional regulator [Virgibacillus halodenitrificans]|uniref:FadR/GntR family transcriptional regulator n=1 Tax=Virgibacillus halodenitrificans TaxID=1482 RepID=UPI001F2EE93A|nr:FadR/GntR family transcriptional regulator [Virgibacillus halodenitrificans]MCG1027106.1 FadR family transcriptional regulator [Virgibacillus halodenitrificans]
MKAVKKKRVSEIVADEIKEYIKKENLTEGDRLPPISTLVTLLGIGRSSLREALQLLENQGIVEILNGRGTFIKQMKAFHIQTAFEVENERQFLLEALEVRIALEGKAVELAAKEATKEDIIKMKSYLEEYIKNIQIGNREQANHSDALFHQTIYNAANNDLLKSMIESLWGTFHEFWNEPFGMEDIFDKSYPFHWELLTAIENHQSDEALVAFHKIMESVRSAIKDV